MARAAVSIGSQHQKAKARASRRDEGIVPPRQDRSRASQAALINAGIRMLERGDYKSLSIAELTASNGLSIGAFYARFSGKEAFFSAVQRQVFEDVRIRAEVLLAPRKWADRPPLAILEAFTEFFMGLVREHRGFILSALQHEVSQPSAWTPLRSSGAAMSAMLADILAPKLTHLAPGERRPRIGFAVQMLYGTLINAVLHDPGPLALADRKMTDELVRALAAYLGIAGRTGPRRTRRSAKRERAAAIT